jgi:hypothetical protein
MLEWFKKMWLIGVMTFCMYVVLGHPGISPYLEFDSCLKSSSKRVVKKDGTDSLKIRESFLSDSLAQRNANVEFDAFILHKGERIEDKLRGNIFFRLETNKSSCFVGEPIIASYKLYTCLRNESKLIKNPSFNGFSVIDLHLSSDSGVETKKINNRDYNVYTLCKAQLYALQSGVIELESATVGNMVLFLKEGAQDVAGNMDAFMNGDKLDANAVISTSLPLSSMPMNIMVKPFPAIGKPSFFNGAVGDFRMSAALETVRFGTGEMGKLTLVISGNGNLPLITTPQINWPKNWEVFEPEVKEEFNLNDIPVSGQKTMIFPFSIRDAGKYEVPAISFGYFDPAAKAYKELKTGRISFEVTNETPDLVSGIKNNPMNAASLSQKIGENRIWVIAFVAFIMGIGIFSWIKIDQKRMSRAAETKSVDSTDVGNLGTPDSMPGQSRKISPFLLSESSLRHHAETQEWYANLNQELKQYLSMHFSMPIAQITQRGMGELADKGLMAESVYNILHRLMQDLDGVVYAPFKAENRRQELLDRCQEWVSSFEQTS